MKVCIIAEGCYPYVVGGVSSWIHSMMRNFPGVEFSLVTIVANRKLRGKFVYDLPENLVSVTEVYLQDVDWNLKKRFGRYRTLKLKPEEWHALHTLVLGEDIDWANIFRLFQRRDISIDRLLMSPAFFDIVKAYYQQKYPNIAFSDFLWTMRSIYMPLLMTLKCRPPKADIYHCIATGYSGIVGSMAKAINPGSTMIVSEHGIYTREREEEIIKAKWVQGIYKDIWIEQFRKMSRCAYAYADQVTALFVQAQKLQIELGCREEKTAVTPNGIDVQAFANIPQKDPNDPYINVGAFVRVSPIKDIKTLINAFYYAHKQNPMLKLWVMGPDNEDEAYNDECHQLVDALHAENIIFTGRIRTTEYIGKMDMLILTSISEGQPLTILEGYAAHKPSIATNVGNCKGLIYGEQDDYGAAGIVVPVLNVTQITEAILQLAAHPEQCKAMGEVGYRRLLRFYQIGDMVSTYDFIYRRLARQAGAAPETGAIRQ